MGARAARVFGTHTAAAPTSSASSYVVCCLRMVVAVSGAVGDPASFCRALVALTLLGPVPAAPAGAPCDLIAAWKPNGRSVQDAPTHRRRLHEGGSEVIVVGIDAHSRSHAAAAIDEQGRLLEEIEVRAGPRGLAQLRAWVEALPRPRLVAIENARGYGLAIVRLLLEQGEKLVDVPATPTCDGRRGSGQRGKHDQGDALVVARLGLR